MPFDEHGHGGGGSGGGGDGRNHDPSDEDIDVCYNAAATTAEINGLCVGCTMFKVAAHATARSLAYTLFNITVEQDIDQREANKQSKEMFNEYSNELERVFTATLNELREEHDARRK